MSVIIAAVDFESASSSKAVVDKAINLANPGDELHLIHITPRVTSAYTAALTLGMIGNELKDLRDRNESAARQMLADLGGDSVDLENIHVVTSGDAAGRLYEQAGRLDGDVLVIGNNHHGTLSLGHVGRKMLHLASFDLYIVHTSKLVD